MNKNNSAKRNILIVGGMIALILLLDQLLKIYVKTHFQLGATHPIIGDWFVMDLWAVEVLEFVCPHPHHDK